MFYNLAKHSKIDFYKNRLYLKNTITLIFPYLKDICISVIYLMYLQGITFMRNKNIQAFFRGTDYFLYSLKKTFLNIKCKFMKTKF